MKCRVFDLGLIDYSLGRRKQEEVFTGVLSGEFEHGLIICRHYPVITLGRQAKTNEIIASKDTLAIKRIPVYNIERGGHITYHGPGQLTIYPIFNLELLKKDLHWFLRLLEESVLVFLKSFNINAQRRTGATGVWVGENKISSIGIAVRKWITFHGLSVNILSSDLDNFDLIMPCGMPNATTALEKELGSIVDIEKVGESLLESFIQIMPGRYHDDKSYFAPIR
mgnify:FL=1